MHEEQRRALDYLARKGTHASVDTLRAQLRKAFADIEARFEGVIVDDRDAQPAPGKWSAHQILDHLVLSHGPAIPQFASLLAGITPEGIAIPANLQSADADRASWDALRTRLGEIHAEFVRLADGAADDLSLEPKALVAIVVKAGGEIVEWLQPLDWKAFLQGVRVHTLEHQAQLERTTQNVFLSSKQNQASAV